MKVRTLRKRKHFLLAASGQRFSCPSFTAQFIYLSPEETDKHQEIIKTSKGQHPCSSRHKKVCFFGYTVTKREGNAVERNRIRRRLKALSLGLAPAFSQKSCICVFIGRRFALSASADTLDRDMKRCFTVMRRAARKSMPHDK